MSSLVTTDAAAHRRLAWRAYAVIAAAMMVAFFDRAALAVIAPELSAEMALTADLLGLLAGGYFAAFACLQLPVGMMLDRIGPRRTLALLLVAAVAGGALFASAGGFWGLLAGHALVGVGTAGLYMGGVVICARWFPPERFATMSGGLLALGNVGSLVAATPLAWSADTFGWRASIGAVAGLTAFLALLILAGVRDAPPGHALGQRAPETPRQVLSGLGRVLRAPQLWRIAALAFAGFATTMALRGLWGGPYLNDVHGLDPVARGNVLLVMSLGAIAGAVVYGPLDRVFDSRRKVALSGAFAVAASLAALAAWRQPPLAAVTAAFFLVAACGQTYVMVLAHGRARFADHLVGRAVTTLNLAAFLGVFTLQAATGFIVRAFQLADGSVPEIGYRAVFAFLAAAIAASAAIYAGADDARPSEDRTRPRIG